MSEEYFNPLLRGDTGALKRALYKSVGFTEEALKRPLIALVNTYTTASPGHCMFDTLCHQVERGVEAAGGTAMVFGTIAPCDGIAEGHEGMRYILPSRDLISSSVECMVRAHRFDGMVLMGSCDKIVPGLLMAAAPPTVFCICRPFIGKQGWATCRWRFLTVSAAKRRRWHLSTPPPPMIWRTSMRRAVFRR